MLQKFVTGLVVTLCLLPLLLGTTHADKSGTPKAALPATPDLPLVWTDIDGRGYSPVQVKANAATVFVFFSTDCPISNAYMGRLHEMEQAYFDRRVRLFLVNSHPLDTPDKMRRYAGARHIVAPLVKDVDGALADRLHATLTPEAIVLDRDGVTRYRGRIDDNKDAARVEKRYLTQALDAVLAGQPTAAPWPKAEGCYIVRMKPPVSAAKAALTYARDIAPILNKNCVDCHRPGEVALFSLLTYKDAQVWARQIKDVTQRRIMPPWKAAPGYGDFHEARILTDRERQMLAAWADAGAPAGDLTRAPKPPVAGGIWPLGKPDVILKPTVSYHVAAEGRDVYRCFVLPIQIKDNVYLDFTQIKPDNRAVVHHIILYADPSGKVNEMNGGHPEEGFNSPQAGTGPPVPEAYMIAAWAPGNRPSPSPAGVAMPIPKGSKLILEVHYHPSGQPEVDRSAIGLTFTRGPITKLWDGAELVQPELTLEPGKADIRVSANLVLPDAVTLYSVAPHMHQIGKEMHVWATTPENKRIELIWLKDWDFNWQCSYDYRQPVKLPKGTKVEMMALYDNSETNPRNPHRPPQRITWGEQTTDEMCVAFLGFLHDAQGVSLQAPDWKPLIEVTAPNKPAQQSASTAR